MSNFHEHYSELLKKLPPYIKRNIWNRLITRFHNPLSEEQASSIHPDVETLLISEIGKYEKKKNRQRCMKQSFEFLTHPSPIQVINSEEEINARVKEATDTIHQKFVETTQETLNSIKQQKDIECEQIKLDMANKSKDLFESTLKKYIRDGTIYYLIHQLEEKDGELYPDISK
jgi:hypothetical protein